MNDQTPSAATPAAIAGNDTLVSLWRYWTAKRGTRAMPLRKDISPLDIPKLLPNLVLIDRTDAGLFRFRLVGTAVAEAYGFDATGKTVDEAMTEPRRSKAKQHYGAAFTSGRPVFTRNRYRTSRLVELVVSRVLLPLADEAGATIMVLMAQTFEYDTAVRGDYGLDATVYPDGDQLEYLA